MIGRISGLLAEKELPWVVVDVNGVGYEIQVPMTTGVELPSVGQPVVLLTQFIVREDAQLLYGFHSKSLREVFRQLIKINGIGPKIALAILSGLDEVGLKRCIDQKDISGLSQLPGIGKKTAERLIVELQDKLDHLPVLLNRPIQQVINTDALNEAVSGLVGLGYKPQEAKKLLDNLKLSPEVVEKTSTTELLKLALKSVMKTK